MSEIITELLGKLEAVGTNFSKFFYFLSGTGIGGAEAFRALTGEFFNVTESVAQYNMPKAGRVKVFRARTSSNTLAATLVINFRRNGSNIMFMSIGAGINTTVKLIATIELAKGDLLSIRHSAGGAAGSTILEISFQLEFDE